MSSISALPPETKLLPGAPRNGPGPRQYRQRSNLGRTGPAQVFPAPTGRFLYVSERTGSTLSALRVDAASGRLAYLSCTPTEREPRGFAIDPQGKFLVAAGQASDKISWIYAIDQASGALKLLDRYPTGKGANWVEIVRFE